MTTDFEVLYHSANEESMTLTMTEPKAAKSKAIKMPLASLRDSLAKISPALAGANTIPVLKSVKIEAGEGATAFTATNL